MQRKLSDCETKGRPIRHKLYTCLLVSHFKWFVILFIKSHYTESSMSEEKNPIQQGKLYFSEQFFKKLTYV